MTSPVADLLRLADEDEASPDPVRRRLAAWFRHGAPGSIFEHVFDLANDRGVSARDDAARTERAKLLLSLGCEPGPLARKYNAYFHKQFDATAPTNPEPPGTPEAVFWQCLKLLPKAITAEGMAAIFTKSQEI